MNINFKKLYDDVEPISYTHPGDAGLDLRSHEEMVLAPGVRHCFKTGIALEIPEGFVGLIWDRSGLSLKEGIKTLGGVVDCGYRGEIGVTLLNTSDKDVKIEKNDRVAQILIQKVEQVNLIEVDKLSSSQRGEGGFGGSGKK
jgi:dUTP pyrophosphatase